MSTTPEPEYWEGRTSGSEARVSAVDTLLCLVCRSPLSGTDCSRWCRSCDREVKLLNDTSWDYLKAYGLETDELQSEREHWNERAQREYSDPSPDRQIVDWEEWWRANPMRRDFYRHVVRGIDVKGMAVLEIGGLGYQGLRLMRSGIGSYGHVEVSDGSQTCSRRKLSALGVFEKYTLHKEIVYVLAPAESLPFADGSFDMVISHGTLHHTYREQSYREIHRVLRDRGYFIFTDNFAGPFIGLLLKIYRANAASADRPLTERDIKLLKSLYEPLRMRATGGVEWLNAYWNRLVHSKWLRTKVPRPQWARTPLIDAVFSRWLFRGSLMFVGHKQ